MLIQILPSFREAIGRSHGRHPVHGSPDDRTSGSRHAIPSVPSGSRRSSATWSGPAIRTPALPARSARRRGTSCCGFIGPSTCSEARGTRGRGAVARSIRTRGSSRIRCVAARLAAGAAIEAVSDVMKRRRSPGALPGPSAGASRPAGRRHGLLHLRATSSLAAAEALARFQLRSRPDRRFRRAPRQRDAGDLLRLRASRIPLDPSLSRSIPGTGAKDETGSGPGLGHTLNIPLPHGTPRATYHAAFRAGLHALADKLKPELVLISAGFDAHAEDPVGDLGLEVEDFEIDHEGDRRGGRDARPGRIVSVLEGGYNVPILAGCVAAHLHALGAEPGPG